MGAITHLINDTAVLASNTTHSDCAWCGDGMRCAFTVTVAGWTDYACVRHVSEYWPELLEGRRPVEDATVFKMLMLVTGRGEAVVGHWVYFNSFNELFKASRSVTGGAAFVDHFSGSNDHYRATGHHRMVFRRTDGAARSPRTHVIIHVIVK